MEAFLRRTRSLHPSKLGILLACPLRYLLETEQHTWTRLPPSPSILLGRAVHATLEAVARGEVPRVPELVRGDVLRRWFTLIAQEESVSAVLESTGREIRENVLLPQSVVSERIRVALAGQEMLPASRPRRGKPSWHRSGSAPKRVGLTLGVEVPLGSSELDVYGQADLVETLPGNGIQITEFKAGRIFSGPGELREDYLLQVSAYALVAAERYSPNCLEVRVIGTDGQWNSVIDTERQHWARERLSELRGALPRGMPGSATELAMPASHCSACPFRPDCGAYKRWAITAGGRRGPIGVSLPPDVWGVLVALEEDQHGLFRARVRDIQGRTVSITSVPVRHVEDGRLVVGCNMEAYSLARRGLAGPALPRNFLVVNRSNPPDSAYAALLRCGSAIVPVTAPAG